MKDTSHKRKRKLSDDDIAQMRVEKDAGTSIAELARRHNVSYSTAYAVFNPPKRRKFGFGMDDCLTLGIKLGELAERIEPGETFELSVCTHGMSFGWLKEHVCDSCLRDGREPKVVARITGWDGLLLRDGTPT